MTARRAAVALVAAALVVTSGCGHKAAKSRSDATGTCRADTRADDGSGHVPNFTDVTYTVQPPAGGNHWVSPASPGVYGPDQIPPQGAVVHALEHGYVAIWYRVGIPEVDVNRIEALGHVLAPDVLVVPQKNLSVPAAVTAWHQRLLCPSVDVGALRSFVEQWRNQGPEKVPHQPTP